MYSLKSKINKVLLNLTLKQKLGLSFGVTIFFLSLLLSFVISRSIRNKVEEDQGYLLNQIGNELVNTFDRLMHRRSTDIKNMTILSEFRQGEKYENNRKILLERLQESYEGYAWIGFVDTTGKVEVSTKNILQGEDVSKRPWFIAGLKGAFVGDVHTALLLAKKLPPLPNGEPLRFLDVAHPVYDDRQELIGVLGAHLSWQWIEDLSNSLIANIPQDKQIGILIINQEGNIIFDSEERIEGQNIFSYLPDLQFKKSSAVLRENNFQGEQYLISHHSDKGYGNYSGLGWHILIKQPLNIAFESINTLYKKIIILGLILATIFSFIGWKIAEIITKPLLKIAQDADLIRKGDRTVSLCQFSENSYFYQGKNEILLLSSSLTDLVQTLISQEYKLTKINQELEEKINGLSLPQIENLADAIFDFQSLDNVIHWLEINT